MAREKGVVKWFSTEKGYGFVRRESGEEIFVHHSDIEVDGYASLRNGESVEFEVFQSDRGPKARKLVPLESEGDAAGGGGPEEPTRRSRRREGGRQSGNRDRAAGLSAAGGGTVVRNGGGRDHAASTDTGGKPLGAQLKERLGRRFPGFGS